MRNGYPLILAVLFLCCSFNVNALQTRREIARERIVLEETQSRVSFYESLVNNRQEIRRLNVLGDSSEILRRFGELARDLENAYLVDDLTRVFDKHYEMRVVYRDIDPVADLYHFYESLFFYLERDVDRTREKLLIVVNDFPNSSKIRQAVELLKAIYVVGGDDYEYINLYNRYQNLATNKSRFWLAQAHYNLGEYELAKSFFESLAGDSVYGYRSRLVLAMIDFVENKIIESIDKFEELKNQYPSTQHHYDILLLSLARVYGFIGQDQLSLNNYREYSRLKGGTLTPEIAYEIGLVAGESGDDDLAISYFALIINQPQRNDYYDRALSRIAVIQAMADDTTSGRELLEDAIALNDAIDEHLILEIDVVNELKREIENVVLSTGNLSSAKMERIERLHQRFQNLNNRRGEVAGEYGSSEFEIISFVNEEYLSLLMLIVEMYDLTEKIAQKSNQPKVETIENQVSEIDSMRVRLYTLRMLDNVMVENVPQWDKILQPNRHYTRLVVMDEINRQIIDSIEIASDLSKRIVSYENLRYELQTRGSDQEIRAVENTLSLLHLEVSEHFGEVDVDNQKIVTIDYELKNLAETRKGLLLVMGLVERSYYSKVAERIKRMNVAMYLDSEAVYDFSLSLLDELQTDFNKANQEFNYALLDILFREVLHRENVYQQLRVGAENVSDPRGGM